MEALDKDYIQAILISIKAIEETSQGNKKTQDRIKQIVENQIKTLEELKKFKQRLDGYAHLKDIDKIWSDCQTVNATVKSLASQIKYAYWIAGGSAGLASIALILLLIKVI